MSISRKTIHEYLEKTAPERDIWKRRNVFYYNYIQDLVKFLVPSDRRVLELGVGTGDLLSHVKPSYGLGLDISSTLVQHARQKFTQGHMQFEVADIEEKIPSSEKNFDVVIISDTLGYLSDVQGVFQKLHDVTHASSRIVITQYNQLWEPILSLASKLKLRMPSLVQNWLSGDDIENLLYLSGFEIVKRGNKMLMPVSIPILSSIFNRYVVNIFPFNHFGLINYLVARPAPKRALEGSVSIVVPARNEAGMIRRIVQELPTLGIGTELIFIEGNSTDTTWETIQTVVKEYTGPHTIKIAQQSGKGKGDAVRKGFDMATGEILMIYDADMTVPPEELHTFYSAIIEGRGDFINGSRLVYPMEEQSMRTLNYIGNKFFSFMFSWLLGQRLKDTLCGTKVLRRSDYEQIKRNRSFFGDFDPFGDFDLLFGAAKLNLKIVDLPVHYRERVYGETNISRWSHGWLLLRMVVFAAKKIKFI